MSKHTINASCDFQCGCTVTIHACGGHWNECPLHGAAAELLEALKGLLGCYVEATGGVKQLDAFSPSARIEEQARAAIAKAKGE